MDQPLLQSPGSRTCLPSHTAPVWQAEGPSSSTLPSAHAIHLPLGFSLTPDPSLLFLTLAGSSLLTPLWNPAAPLRLHLKAFCLISFALSPGQERVAIVCVLCFPHWKETEVKGPCIRIAQPITGGSLALSFLNLLFFFFDM